MKRRKKDYAEVTASDYKYKFGIGTDKKKTREAYNRAWKNRDFEINKFWSRSAYFWGFIAAIFAGYIAVITSTKGMLTNMDVYLVSLGLLFSVAWLLVIKGSKRWQENWEHHIDQLEDEITGPLYKTVYREGKSFYSVSKVNEILAWVVIAVWIVLYMPFVIETAAVIGGVIKKIMDVFKFISGNKRIVSIIISFAGIVAGIICLAFKARSDYTGYTTKLPKDKKGQFIDRYSLQ